MKFYKKIIHIDMDCFYAAVEMRENPNLIGKPVAVGGFAENRGVLATCNYEARKFGLHSAMSSKLALKKCPQLILIPTQMQLYREVSQQIRQILLQYTEIIEPLSLDEAYLDVTDCDKLSGSATWIAAEIRQHINQQLKLTASAGVAPLKFLAKIASDINKPNGQYVIAPHQVNAFVTQLALKKIPGVGQITAQQLAKLGLVSCYDVQQFDLKRLIDLFGKQGQRIWDFSHAIDERSVEPNRIRKSIGVEKTFMININQLEIAQQELAIIYQKLLQRLPKDFSPDDFLLHRKLSIKLKFADFKISTVSKTMNHISLANFENLLTEIWNRKQAQSIRLLGIQINLIPPKTLENTQASLWIND